MTCKKISALLGIECLPLSRGGNLLRVGNPFTFDDGDGVQIYAEESNGMVRFFDDGAIVMHFMGRGLTFEDGRKSKFIKTAADGNGVSFTDEGDLELWTKKNEAPVAFAKFLNAVMQIADWERNQRGALVDAVLLIDEVALQLRAWKPGVELTFGPEYVGVTQQVHKLDMQFDGQGVLVTGPNTQAVGSAVRRLLDIKSGPQSGAPLLVIIDDRQDAAAAKRESMVIQAVAPVMAFTRLEKNARADRGSAH